MVDRGRPGGVAGGIDAVLEASVVGSFTRLGPALRRKSAAWLPLHRRPGRVVVLTGASSGLGRAAAEQLGELAMTVVCVGRDAERTEEAATAVTRAGGRGIAELCDLADLDATAALGAKLEADLDHIDVLIHNAGALLQDHTTTARGHEVTLTVHLLSPHLLTSRLRATLDAAEQAKVLTMTSGGMYTERFDLEHLEMGPDSYRGSVAYARAKRAQVVWTLAEQARQPAEGIDFSLVHPGWAKTPGVESSLPTFDRLLGPLLRSPGEGVDTLCWLASLEPGDPPGGQLWLDRAPRSLFKLPSTRVDEATLARQGDELLAWLDEVTAPGS